MSEKAPIFTSIGAFGGNTMYIAPTELSNGLKYHSYKVATKDDYIYCALIVRSGSLCDIVQGTAHFLEHILLTFVKMYGYNRSKELPITGKTSFDRTCFYFGCNAESFEKAINLIKTIIFGEYLQKKYFEPVRRDILAEYSHCSRAVKREYAFLSKVSKDLSSFIPIGTKGSIESLKFDNIMDFYVKEYSMNNMLLSIVGDVDTERIDELVNTPGCCFIERLNQIQNKVTEFDGEKESEHTEIFIPIAYTPFVHCNELYDNISLSLITYILRAFPSNGTICIGIKEYSKHNRFINIRINSGESADEILLFIKRGLIRSIKNGIEIQFVRNEVENKLLSQVSESGLLRRIEDFFVYNTKYHHISEVINQIPFINFKSIRDVVNNLFKVSPILVENKISVIVREIVDWSIA